jgi:beta-galactosidase
VHIARRADPVERTAIDPGHKPRQSNLPEPLLRDWTPSNIAPHSESVRVFTNCEEAELFLNGQSMGRQKLHPDATPLTWEVPYAPGSLKAVAYREGRSVAKDELRTAGKAARILLTPERATLSSDGNDVLTVVATVVDDAGVQVPDSDPAASGEVQFSVSGPAEIVATDNGSVTDHESFLLPRHHLYGGRVIAILRATAPSGSVLVHASTADLADGDAWLTVIPSRDSGFARAF